MAGSRLAQPLQLPCGLEIKNRLAKAALAEQMSDRQQLPTTAQLENTYGAWGDGGWGMILTGNFQIDLRHLGGPADITVDEAAVPDEKSLESFKKLAATCRREGTPTIVQINHPGRQSPLGAGKRSIFSKTLAPSAVPLNIGSDLMSRILASIVFGTPKEMTQAEIDDVVQRFANAAKICVAAGFDGIEIHAAHGYLLAQFMSDQSNRRTDAYGGSAAARVKIVVDIIHAVRAVVPKTFCVGLKLNSADHQDSSDPESSKRLQDCLEQASILVDAGLDFIEISGGTYENPTMMTGIKQSPKSERTAARESFFLDFARQMRARLPNTVLMVTGGFRSRLGMQAALEEGACDIIGIGRPAILNPRMPADLILNPKVGDADATVQDPKIPTHWLVKLAPKAVGAGAQSTWYNNEMKKIGK